MCRRPSEDPVLMDRSVAKKGDLNQYSICESPSSYVRRAQILLILGNCCCEVWNQMHIQTQSSWSQRRLCRIQKRGNRINYREEFQLLAFDSSYERSYLHQVIRVSRRRWLFGTWQAHSSKYQVPECLGYWWLYKHPQLKDCCRCFLPNLNLSLKLAVSPEESKQ